MQQATVTALTLPTTPVQWPREVPPPRFQVCSRVKWITPAGAWAEGQILGMTWIGADTLFAPALMSGWKLYVMPESQDSECPLTMLPESWFSAVTG